MRIPRSINNLFRRRRLANFVHHAQRLVRNERLRTEHPETDRAGVDINKKLLRRGADCDLGKVLALLPEGSSGETAAGSRSALGFVGGGILDELAKGRGKRVGFDIQAGEGLVIRQKTVVGGLIMMDRVEGGVVVS